MEEFPDADVAGIEGVPGVEQILLDRLVVCSPETIKVYEEF